MSTDDDADDGLTPAQRGLLWAVQSIAENPDAPGAQYATERLCLMLTLAFGLPVPETQGGLVEAMFGKRVWATPGGTP